MPRCALAWAAQRDRVNQEIRLLMSLEHPGIVKLVDVFVTRAHIFIVTERAMGGDVRASHVPPTPHPPPHPPPPGPPCLRARLARAWAPFPQHRVLLLETCTSCKGPLVRVCCGGLVGCVCVLGGG